LYLFKKDTKLKWQVIQNEFKLESTRESLKFSFRAAVVHLGLEHMFEEVRGQSQTPHIRICNLGSDGIYASSFFPPTSGDLAVTRHWAALCSRQKIQVLEHEIGHIIGLRHEHAQLEDDLFVRLFPANEKSFMSSAFHGLQETDRLVINTLYISYDDAAIKKKLEGTGVTLNRVNPQHQDRRF
jgi:hypothetical protein